MARTDPVFNLRMPSDMKEALAKRAKKNGRSLNAEILQIIEDSMLHEIDESELDGIAFRHADAQGIQEFSEPKEIIVYIEKKTESFKNQMINDLKRFTKKPE